MDAPQPTTPPPSSARRRRWRLAGSVLGGVLIALALGTGLVLVGGMLLLSWVVGSYGSNK